jgi:hypothetical protein
MTNILLLTRYLVFGLLVICNAIICSVAVWNLSLAQSVGQSLQVDAYLTFLGAFALVFIFVIIFVEILRKNDVTGRLWFEVLWVGLFWIMELSGAAAVSALAPNLLCNVQSVLGSNNACTSAHVLLAFCWLSNIILLVYLVCLMCTAIIRQKQDPQIWHASVAEVCRSDTRHGLGSAPTSPSLPRFHKMPEMIAPQPRRPLPTAVYSYRSGMGPEYQIEHFRPSSPVAERPTPLTASVALFRYSQQKSHAVVAQPSVPAPSLYPQHLRSSLAQQPSGTISPSPPPLGNWPRPNAVDQPLRRTRKPPPPTFIFPARDSQNAVSGTVLSTNQSSTYRSRPSGSNGNRRPPPLNLTNISAFRVSG